MTRRPPGPRLRPAALVLLGAPWLLGARGCIEELSVGMEEVISSPDGGSSDAGAVDANTGGLCAETPCSEPAPEAEPCWDGSLRQWECRPRLDAASCEWQTDACPLREDAGTEECTPDDCGIIFFFNSNVSNEFGCSDGSEPQCKRDDHQQCTYQCPEALSCDTQSNTCGPDTFCAFVLGTCGNTGQSGFCKPKPQSCTDDDWPVCGCDGVTYPSVCEAFRAGVSVSYERPCSSEPELCDTECTEEQPVSITDSTLCPDGQHARGYTCVTKPDGGCAYQWLECSYTGACTLAAKSEPEPGKCWTEDDCPPEQECVGASVCPCEAKCFSPDTPGHCE